MLNKDDPQGGHNPVSDLTDMSMLPGGVTLSCAGMPTIQRGNQIYVDMNTGTTLDNIYVVRSISHSISAGKFDTTLDLQFVAQATVDNFREKMVNAVKKIGSN